MEKYLFLVLASLLVCCTTTKQYTLENYPGNLILFGSSGGFTNESEEFRIYDNGQFEKYSIESKTIVKLKKLDKNICKQIFRNFYELGLDELKLNAPGNMNYYIKMQEESSDIKLLWGSFDEPAPAKLIQYYKVLGQLAKNAKTY